MTSPRRYSTPNVPSDAQPSESGLLGPIEVHAICQALGVRPTKTLGQNFVHDAGTVRRIVRDAGIGEGTQVIEVGPGLGSLTLGLLEAGARVRAIEIDPVLARALPVTVAQRMPEAAERLHVINRDAVQINGLEDFEDDWPAPTHLVANLPYNVAVPLLLSMLESFPSLESALVMVQAEVADRLAAQPGSRTYGVPSVKAAWYGTATRAGTIGRSVFWPVPNVDSALVELRRSKTPRGDTSLRLATFEVCDTAFSQRRKTLRAALKNWAGSAELAQELCDRADVDSSIRGEKLGIDDYVRLGSVLLEMRAEGKIPLPEQDRYAKERRAAEDSEHTTQESEHSGVEQPRA